MSEVNATLAENMQAVFRALMECSTDFICLATAHGELFYLNSTARRWLGLADDASLASITLHDFYTDDSWRELRDVAVPGVNKTGQWEGRSRLQNIKTKQQTSVQTFMYRLKIPPTRSAGAPERPSCLAIVHREAESVNRLRESLTEAQARKTSILESSLDPIITINHEGHHHRVQPGGRADFRPSARESARHASPPTCSFPPRISAGQQDRIDRYLDVGEGSMLGRRVEVTAVRANGETFTPRWP